MTADEFLVRQTELYDAVAPTWERWTIDEVDGDVVRVLVARARETDWLRSSSELVLAEATASGDSATTHLSSTLRGEVMEAELESPQLWEDEMHAFMPQQQLGRFLDGRAGKPGLPTDRPLREGDAFWILAASAVPALAADVQGEALELPMHMASLEEAGAQVWDVTAGARQAAKAAYQALLQASDKRAELVGHG